MDRKPLYQAEFSSWDESVSRLLNATDFAQLIPEGVPVLIKPNLVEPSPPPITTPCRLVEAIIDYIRRVSPGCYIIVGEGCGAMDGETEECFAKLGYTELASRKSVELVDLNYAPCRRLSDPECRRWPEMFLPELVFGSFLLSVPVLKAHSIADVTLTMKNMLGLAPPRHYDSGSWKKSAFHSRCHEAIFDLNRYRYPDFTVLDATVGMAEAHLWGPVCDPKPNLLLAGADPVAVDARGAQILRRDWRNIPHISMANGILGFETPRKMIYV